MLDNSAEKQEFIQAAYYSSLKILSVIEEQREFIQESRQSSLNLLFYRILEHFWHHLSEISESIRNPLNEITGALNLILDDMLDNPDEEREFIQEAHHSSLKILSVINQLSTSDQWQPS